MDWTSSRTKGQSPQKLCVLCFRLAQKPLTEYDFWMRSWHWTVSDTPKAQAPVQEGKRGVGRIKTHTHIHTKKVSLLQNMMSWIFIYTIWLLWELLAIEQFLLFASNNGTRTHRVAKKRYRKQKKMSIKTNDGLTKKKKKKKNKRHNLGRLTNVSYLLHYITLLYYHFLETE